MNSQQVELVVRRPGQPERRMLLSRGVTSLGRAEDNDLVLPDIGVSRRHARVVVDDQNVFVEDLGSGNGTYFRGRKVERQTVADGDEVVIDPFVLAFRLRGSGAPEILEAETLRATPEMQADSASARLIVLAGHRLAPSYAIRGNMLTMGRSEGRDVVLYDPAASRNHAQVEKRADGYWLVDERSANGTHVGSERVREFKLSVGDRIRIGATEFRFEIGGDSPLADVAPVQPVETPAAIQQLPTVSRTPVQAPESMPATISPAAYLEPPGARETIHRPPRKRRGAFGLITVAAVALVGFVGVVVVGLAGVGGWYWWSTQQASERAAAIAAIATPAPVAHKSAPANQAEVDQLLEEGKLLFYEGRHLESVQRLYKLLHVEPTHQEAERLGYLGCEHVVMRALRDDAYARSVTGDADKRRARTDALSQADRALAGKGDLDEAQDAVDRALILNPDDRDLVNARGKVRRARSKAHKAFQKSAKLEELAALYSASSAALDSGRTDEAVKGFVGVLMADPDAHTYLSYDARFAIVEARRGATGRAAEALAGAVGAVEKEDWKSARPLLVEVLALEPDNEKAVKLHRMVREHLDGNK